MDNTRLKPILILFIFALGLFIALSPSVIYAPTPRIVLFFMLSIVPAILFGSEVASKFEVTLPGFVFSVAGAGALFFGALFLLDNLSKPAERIAIYYIIDENGQDQPVDVPGLLDVKSSKNGLAVNYFTKGNALVLIFPEQISEIEISIKQMVTLKPYRGAVSYSGNRKLNLKLGTDLIQ